MESCSSELSLFDIAQNEEMLSAVGELPVPIVVRSNGTLVAKDLASIPHMIVAGISGSGKTSFVRSLIGYLVYQYDYRQVRFIIYDSKGVEYSDLKESGSLYLPVVTDAKKAYSAVCFACTEMRKRFQLFSEAGFKDIFSFNLQKEQDSPNRIPHVFLIFDDVVSLLSAKETVEPLTRLLQDGRPAGLHVFFVSSLIGIKDIRKNDLFSCIPCRVAFRLSNGFESFSVLGFRRAESLAAPGSMFFKFQSSIEEGKAIHFPENVIHNAIIQRGLQSGYDESGQPLTPYNRPFALPYSSSSAAENSLDELLPVAVDVVFETSQASVSMIQRKLKLGYSRAAKIVDQMEEIGIVGPFEGSKPRQLQITKHQWETELKKQLLSTGSMNASPASEKRFCSNCGNALMQGANYCARCGKRIK